MKNLFSRLMIITLLITNSAIIMPMESDSTQESAAMECEETCTLCLSEGLATEFRELGCGHRFCVTCLAELLRLGLDEEWAQSMAKHLHCPKKGCQYQMDETDIQAISGNQARVARYQEVLTRLFFNANRNIRHCPTAACEVMYEPSFRPELITCRACKATYCSYCQYAHGPDEACRTAAQSIQNNNNATNATISAEELQERQYQEWLRANTKPCPQCKSNIQKNGGCNHMTCRNCRHEFC